MICYIDFKKLYNIIMEIREVSINFLWIVPECWGKMQTPAPYPRAMPPLGTEGAMSLS
jgi:hypothetical protein